MLTHTPKKVKNHFTLKHAFGTWSCHLLLAFSVILLWDHFWWKMITCQWLFFQWLPLSCLRLKVTAVWNKAFIRLVYECPLTRFFFHSRLLLLLIFFAIQIFMFLVHNSLKNAVVPVKLVPELYFLKPGEKPHKYKTSLLLQNSTGERVWKFVSVCCFWRVLRLDRGWTPGF